MAGRQDWGTPAWLFEALDRIYGPFVLDAAARGENALAPAFCADGLVEPWRDPTYCNPPYGKDRGGVEAWVRKALLEAERGVRSVLLLDAGLTSTRWFTELVIWPWLTQGRPRVVFLPRLMFQSAPSTARFSSLLVVIDGKDC